MKEKIKKILKISLACILLFCLLGLFILDGIYTNFNVLPLDLLATIQTIVGILNIIKIGKKEDGK